MTDGKIYDQKMIGVLLSHVWKVIKIKEKADQKSA